MAPFCVDEDVLISPRGARSAHNLPSYIYFQLTGPTRAYILLTLGNGLPPSRALTLSANAPSEWTVLGQIENASGGNDGSVSDAGRWENDPQIPIMILFLKSHMMFNRTYAVRA